MELNDATTLAHTLMQMYGLASWRFAFNQRKRAFGLCNFTRKTIYLSAPLTEINDEPAVRDTLLHEIAHALAGPAAKHGLIWQEIATRIGATPRRCFGSEVKMLPSRYILVCPNCGQSVSRHRPPTRAYACWFCCRAYNGSKFSEKYQLVLC